MWRTIGQLSNPRRRKCLELRGLMLLKSTPANENDFSENCSIRILTPLRSQRRTDLEGTIALSIGWHETLTEASLTQTFSCIQLSFNSV